eukprot:scaffold28228_cov111-Isochrysis_galbana.AAC.2
MPFSATRSAAPFSRTAAAGPAERTVNAVWCDVPILDRRLHVNQKLRCNGPQTAAAPCDGLPRRCVGARDNSAHRGN